MVGNAQGCKMKKRLVEMYWEAATAAPDKIALLTENSQMSNSDLLGLAHVLDMQLSSRGVSEGDTVALTTSRSELCIAFALVVSLRSLTGLFCSARDLLGSGIEFDWALTTAPVADLPDDKQLLIEADWFSLIGTGALPDYRNLGKGRGRIVTTTSGTTGNRKFVSIPEAEKLRDMIEMDWHDRDEFKYIRLLSTSSPITGWALNKYLPALLWGGTVVALSEHINRSPQYIDLYGVTHLSTTPAHLLNLLDVPNAGQYLTSLREIEVAGAYAPPQLLSRISELCPKAKIETAYGATEVGALVRADYETLKTAEPGYLGEIFRKDTDLEILQEDSMVVGDNATGVLAVTLPGDHGRRYLGDHPDDDQTIGFTETHFLTGDLVRRDGNSIYFEGRTKNVLNLNANKYSLDQVGRVLTSAFTDTEFVPIAYVSDEGIEQLGIFCAGAKPVSLAAVNSVLTGKWPLLSATSLWQVEAIPHTSTGKADVQQLIDSKNLVLPVRQPT